MTLSQSQGEETHSSEPQNAGRMVNESPRGFRRTLDLLSCYFLVPSVRFIMSVKVKSRPPIIYCVLLNL